MTFGERVKKLRTELGLSQPRLAEMVVGSRDRRQLVYEWEQDNGRPSNGEWLLSLAKSLGTSVSYLYGETDDPRPAPQWRTGEGPATEWEALIAAASAKMAEAQAILNSGAALSLEKQELLRIASTSARGSTLYPEVAQKAPRRAKAQGE
jgi:transcriptional regulator with XRE-family HTH domain